MSNRRSTSSFENDDFAYLYILSLKEFAESLGFKIPKNINPSWLIHNFQSKYKSHLIDYYKTKEENAKDSDEKLHWYDVVNRLTRQYYTWRNPSDTGRELYQLGIIDFELIQPESESIFSQHLNLIKSLQKIMPLPKGISLSITEPNPYLLDFNFKRNISEITKLKDLPQQFRAFDNVHYVKEFLKMFQEYTGLVNTKITKGGYEYDYSIEEVGFRDLLSLFIKKLKSEIKTSEFVDFIKGIKISNESDRHYLTTLDFLIKNASEISWYNTRDRAKFQESWRKFKNEFVPKVAKEMGHPSLIDFIGVDSPTARRV